MDKKYIKIALILLISITVVVTAGFIFLEKRSYFTWFDSPNNVYAITLVVVGDEACPPYTFIDEDGKPGGFCVELIYYLADKMNCNVDLQLVSHSRALELFADGKADILLNAVHGDFEGKTTLPLTVYTYAAFSTDNREIYLTDISGASLAALSGDKPVIEFADLFFTNKLIFYDSYDEAVEAVLNGECDYAIIPENVGKSLSYQNGYGLRAVSDGLISVTGCFAVNNPVILKDCDYQLGILDKDGILAQVSDNWLNKYVQYSHLGETLVDNLDLVVIFLLLILLLAISAILLVERNSIKKMFVQEERARIYEETSDDSLFEYFPSNDELRFTYKDKITHETVRDHFDGFLRGEAYKKHVSPELQKEFMENVEVAMKTDDLVVYEFNTKMLDDIYHWHRISMRRIRDINGHLISLVGRMENIHREKIQREEVKRRAMIDSLTGLLNRPTFFDKVDDILTNKKRLNCMFMMLDIDGFKNLNDTKGHTFGDLALTDFAKNLSKAFRMNEYIGRFGGDEFMIFDVDVVEKALHNKLDYLNQCLAESDGDAKGQTCSVGVILTESKNIDARQLLTAADEVLYRVKGNGKNNFIFEKKNFD